MQSIRCILSKITDRIEGRIRDRRADGKDKRQQRVKKPCHGGYFRKRGTLVEVGWVGVGSVVWGVLWFCVFVP